MRLEKSKLDTQNARGGDQGAQGSLESCQQCLHKGVIAVWFVEHSQAKQDVGVMCHFQDMRAPFAGA
jgi:hypothetical protein